MSMCVGFSLWTILKKMPWTISDVQTAYIVLSHGSSTGISHRLRTAEFLRRD